MEAWCPALSADGERWPYATVSKPFRWTQALRRFFRRPPAPMRCTACGAALPDRRHVAYLPDNVRPIRKNGPE